MADFLDGLSFNQTEELLKQSEFIEMPPHGIPVTSASPTCTKPREERFGTIDQSEINNFIVDQENKNTRRKTLSDVKLFTLFLAEQGENRPIEQLTVCELDNFFGNFITIVKKPNKTDYEPSSVRGFMSSLERYLRQRGYTQNISKNPSFPHSNNALKAKLSYLKAMGHGNKPNESEELTDEDIDKLFECGQLGNETATQIVNLLHLTFSLVMGMRGGREQHQLKWGDIEICTDEDGDKYLQHTRERQTKTRTGTDPKDTRKFKPKAYNNKDCINRCPVLAYERLKSNRPTSMMAPDAPFFLSINHTFGKKEQGLMFKNCAMGINHIYGLVKKMISNCENIQDKRLTNHSVRKHLLQKCNDIGLPPNQTIQISGHKNIGSVNNYSKMNTKQQKDIAMQITSTTPSHDLPREPGAMTNNRRNSPVIYSQQATKSTCAVDVESMFHGTTIIHGGTFNFYNTSESRRDSPPKNKYRRILPIESDSDTDSN